MNPPSRKALFIAQDPGAFNAVFPVIRRYREKGWPHGVALAGACRPIAKAKGFSFTDVEGVEDHILQQTLADVKPDILVYGVAHGDLSIDKRFAVLAQKKNVKTLAVIDFWSNYRARFFSNPDTNDCAYLPDVICVIDEYMKEGMIAVGFDAEKLHITGNPFFETFSKVLPAKGSQILFTSQPYSETTGASFDEVAIFADIIRALEKLGSKLPVVIGFHPREVKRHKYDSSIKASGLSISVATLPTEELLDVSKLVIGIRTMMLFEAALRGKKVISYQPGLTRAADVLVSNHLGLSSAAYTYPELLEKVGEMLTSKTLPRHLEAARRRYVYSNATDRVIKEIETLAARI